MVEGATNDKGEGGEDRGGEKEDERPWKFVVLEKEEVHEIGDNGGDDERGYQLAEAEQVEGKSAVRRRVADDS